MLIKIAIYIGFCAYRRSYLIWSPVIVFIVIAIRKKATTTKKSIQIQRSGPSCGKQHAPEDNTGTIYSGDRHLKLDTATLVGG